ncbi:MAG: bifunctional nuclease domain-containing protein [Rubrobacteraceae bacterium]
MKQNGLSHQIDARPSDAIALALRLEAPIRVSSAVFDEASYDSREEWMADHERGELRPGKDRK